MKKFMTPFCATALLLMGTMAGSAQDRSSDAKQSKEVQQDTKTMTNNGTTKSSVDTVNGKVESYDAGKSLKVSVPGKIITSKSFSLDSKDYTYNVASDLKPGDWVTVSEKTDNRGHKTLTVKHSKSHANAHGESYR
jgi:hypothetical protein